MAFTYTRYHTPIGPTHAAIRGALDAFAFKPIDPESEHDTAAGWCAFEGTHLDGVGTPDVGQYAAVGLRIDTLKIQPKVLKHHVEREVAAREKDGPKLSRYQRAEVKEAVIANLRKTTAPSIAHFQWAWDLDTGTVWLFSASKKVRALFGERFEQCFGVALTAEAIWTRARRDVLDVHTIVGLAPWNAVECGEDEIAPSDYDPDALDGINRTFHLGPEFLAWLWWQSEANEGEFDVTAPLGAMECGPFECWFDDRLVMSGTGAEQTDTFAGGHPSSSSEAKDALRSGKMPESARLRIVRGAQEWSFTVKADLGLSGVKIPSVLSSDEADAFAERLLLLEQLDAMLWALVWQYVEVRTGSGWEETFAAIQEWALGFKVRRDAPRFVEPQITEDDVALVLRETNVPIAATPERMRPMLVAACKMSMGELLTTVEAAEAADGKRGKVLRQVWDRRREMGELRENLAYLKGREAESPP